MRLDQYLTEKGIFETRTKAKQSIERGEIFINGKCISKVSFQINEFVNYKVERICENSFVSIGGFKLQKALVDFNFSPKDLIVADIGASTGGFTDCLLINGAKKVYAVDLNDQLLHDKLQNDNRVVSIIKNARELSSNDFNEKVDLIVADLSFISVTCVLETFSNLLSNNAKLIILIKPQFENGEKKKFKNGIIKDKKIQLNVCNEVYDYALQFGLVPQKFTIAPIVEGKNVEFLMMFEKNGAKKLMKNQIVF